MLVGLANDQNIMADHSQEEQALMKIQDEWSEARVKGGQWKVVASKITPVLGE